MSQTPRSTLDKANTSVPSCEANTIARYGKIYALANVVNRSAGFLLIPLYTHLLTLAEYGLLAMVLAVTDILCLLFGLGFTSALSRFYFDAAHDREKTQQVVSTVFLGVLCMSLLICLLALPLSYAIALTVFNNLSYLPLLATAIFGLIFTILFEVELGYVTVQKKAWLYFFMSLGKAVLFIALNFVFVYELRLGVQGIIYATFISMALLSLVGIIVIFKHVGFKFSYPLFIDLLKFGLPLVPSAMANTGMTLTERYFLNLLAGPAAVGAYALAERLTSLLRMFIAAPFSQIFFVRRFESLVAGDNQQAFHRIFLIFVALMSVAALGLSLLGAEIISIIAPSSYQGLIPLIPLMGLCFVLSSINQNVELGLLYEKKTGIIAYIGIACFMLCIPINYALISLFNAMGAVYALLLVNIVRLLMTTWASKKIGADLIKLDWASAILIMLLATSIGIFFTQAQFKSFDTATLTIKILSGFSFIILVFFSPIFNCKVTLSAHSLDRSLLKKKAHIDLPTQ